MRKLRSLFALLLTLCLLAGISAVAFAAGEDQYRIRVYGGAQNNRIVYEGTYTRGSTVNLASALSSFLGESAGKYYVKGIRESGKEESHEYAFPAEKDEDFVLTYGLRGNQIVYFVRYVDAGGNDLRNPSGPFYANSGDRIYVAFIEIAGYQPDAYNRTRILNEDYTFVFNYSRIPTPAPGGGGGVNPANPANPVNPANPANPDNGNANNPGGNNGQPLEIIDEDLIPQAGPGGSGQNTGTETPAPTSTPKPHGTSALWQRYRGLMIAGLILLALLIALLYWYLLFYRKKKRYEAEKRAGILADDGKKEEGKHVSE